MYKNLNELKEKILKNISFKPTFAIVLGSGLGGLVNKMQVEYELPYSEIEGVKPSKISGHGSKFLFGKLNGKNIVAMSGRIHYYEGYDMKTVVSPIVLLKLIGVETLFLTNASGGINSDFTAGTLMAINDHISTFVPSALIGENDDTLGERFPDMSSVYDKELLEKLFLTAQKENIDLKQGVYLQTTGPNYETKAEIKMFKMLGADAVGMSTSQEAMMGNYLKMKVLGVSCITNMATGIVEGSVLNHKEVVENAKKAEKNFTTLVESFIKEYV